MYSCDQSSEDDCLYDNQMQGCEEEISAMDFLYGEGGSNIHPTIDEITSSVESQAQGIHDQVGKYSSLVSLA